MAETSCGRFLLDRVPAGIQPKAFFANYRLDENSTNALRLASLDDARRYTYNAATSLLAAFNALRSTEFAWAVTKLYYSAFYSGRAGLCRVNHVIFHAPILGSSGFTQFELAVAKGNVPKVVDKPPSTHKLVAKRFSETGHPSFMSSLEIDGKPPLNWLMENREYWQYRAARFPDPDCPDLFVHFEQKKANRLLEEYYTDSSGIFISDPEHAMIALPFRLVAWCLEQDALTSHGVVSNTDRDYLRKRCHMGQFTLSRIKQLLGT
jgi:hypothetical protein